MPGPGLFRASLWISGHAPDRPFADSEDVAMIQPPPPNGPATHVCPKCQSVLRKRSGSSGAFWGCTAYPNCKYTQADVNGSPFVPAPAASCPHCSPPGLPDTPMEQKHGRNGPYWRCTRCDGTANDRDGKPAKKREFKPADTRRQLRNYSETTRTGRHPSPQRQAPTRDHHRAAQKEHKKILQKAQLGRLNWGANPLPPDQD